MNKKKYFLIFNLLFVLFLVGCNKDEKIDNETELGKEQETSYINLAKTMDKSINSNSDFEELRAVFESNKSNIDSILYENNFDMDKLSNKNIFDFGYVIVNSELDEIFLEKLDDGTVNIIIITKLDISFDDGGEDHSDIPQISYQTSLYKFKDGKMIDYKTY